jgi:drug/metabolite transporter (DMT)-like permease
MFSRNDIYYNLVVVWALAGILLKRLADTATTDMAVTIASVAGISILGLCIIIQLARKRGPYNRAAR